ASGESSSVSRFNCAADSTKTAAIATVNPPTNPRESSPAGMARERVRGFSASSPASAQRLKAMAADRALTLHTMIQTSCIALGSPLAASIAPVSAKGSANTECSHLIISSVTPTLRTNPMFFSLSKQAKAPPHPVGAPLKLPLLEWGNSGAFRYELLAKVFRGLPGNLQL